MNLGNEIRSGIEFYKEEFRNGDILDKGFLICAALFFLSVAIACLAVYFTIFAKINFAIFGIQNFITKFLVFLIFNCGYLGLGGLIAVRSLEDIL